MDYLDITWWWSNCLTSSWLLRYNMRYTVYFVCNGGMDGSSPGVEYHYRATDIFPSELHPRFESSMASRGNTLILGII